MKPLYLPPRLVNTANSIKNGYYDVKREVRRIVGREVVPMTSAVEREVLTLARTVTDEIINDADVERRNQRGQQ